MCFMCYFLIQKQLIVLKSVQKWHLPIFLIQYDEKLQNRGDIFNKQQLFKPNSSCITPQCLKADLR